MGAAVGTCREDGDCGCFSPVVAEASCGGITDAPTADKLRAIEARFHAIDCPWPHDCAAWACVPHCVDGRCRNSGSGGLIIP